MSVDQAKSELLSPEEERALLPLRAKWEKELASLELQLTTLTNRKSELTRVLASLNGIIPSKDDSQSAAVETPLSPNRGPAPGAAGAVNPIPALHRAEGGRKRFAPVSAYWL